MEQVDCVVIGAGVVGSAVARALAQQGREVIILEAENAFGTITSARNSEVIHAGIYYPAGSLKAELRARQAMLYDYCADHHVSHQRCGKLIVATSREQVATLDGIRQAAANGVDDLRLLSRDEARALEPQLECQAALLSPSTGIIDSHGLMTALLGDAERAGAMLAVQSPVLSGAAGDTGIRLEVGAADGAGTTTLLARSVVNAAGLTAPPWRAASPACPLSISAAVLRQGLLFHAGRPRTLLAADLPGARGRRPGCAPDARHGRPGTLRPERALDRRDRVWRRPVGRRQFLWRGAPLLARTGRRHAAAGLCRHPPKISGPGETAADFRIDGPAVHGVPGLVNLFGIESPGLTSSLAIGERAALLA